MSTPAEDFAVAMLAYKAARAQEPPKPPMFNTGGPHNHAKLYMHDGALMVCLTEAYLSQTRALQLRDWLTAMLDPNSPGTGYRAPGS